MIPTNISAQLAAARAKVAKLEAAAAQVRNQELAKLPAKLGFSNMAALIEALKAIGSSKAVTPVKRKRGKVTPETRIELKKLVEAGKTGVEIAQVLGVSLPTVQNIKKELGLVRTTKKAAPKKSEPKAKAAPAKTAKVTKTSKEAAAKPAK